MGARKRFENGFRVVKVYVEPAEYFEFVKVCGSSMSDWARQVLVERVFDGFSETEAVEVHEGGVSKRRLRQRSGVTSGSVVQSVPVPERNSPSHPKSRDMADYKVTEAYYKDKHHPRCPCNICAEARK